MRPQPFRMAANTAILSPMVSLHYKLDSSAKQEPPWLSYSAAGIGPGRAWLSVNDLLRVMETMYFTDGRPGCIFLKIPKSTLDTSFTFSSADAARRLASRTKEEFGIPVRRLGIRTVPQWFEESATRYLAQKRALVIREKALAYSDLHRLGFGVGFVIVDTHGRNRVAGRGVGGSAQERQPQIGAAQCHGPRHRPRGRPRRPTQASVLDALPWWKPECVP